MVTRRKTRLARHKKTRTQRVKCRIPPFYLKIAFVKNGLQYRILVVYNDVKGAYSIIRQASERVWTIHQNSLYPALLPFEQEVTQRKNDLEMVFDRFKADVLRIDPTAKIVRKQGKP